MASYEMTIPGLLPGLNTLLAAGQRIYHLGRRGRRQNDYQRVKRRYEDVVIRAARAAKIPPLEAVRLEFVWLRPNRREDPDNIAAGGRKIILDALVRCGVLPGDGWRHIDGWTDTFAVDRVEPRTRVVLTVIR